MNDINLIPKEAFEPLGDVANNLIDKISNAIGYIYTPRGKRKDRIEAAEYLINEIKENKEMPPLVKAAAISESRKIIKEYLNKNRILDIAIENLADNSKVDELEDDWLFIFFDKAGKVSSKDAQMLFGRILSEECNKPRSVSKSLVNVLGAMDSASAESFRKLRNYIFSVEKSESNDEGYVVVIPDVSELQEIEITFDDIIELTRLGLVEYLALGEYTREFKGISLEYAEKTVKITSKDKLPIGSVVLTRIGQELANILMLETPDYGYYNETVKYWKKNGADIIENFNI